MTKSNAFAIIKEANALEDRIALVQAGTEEYSSLVQAQQELLDLLLGLKWGSLHQSKRTGHWFIKVW